MASEETNWRKLLESLFSPGLVSHGNSIADGLFIGKPIIVYGAGECTHWFHEIVMRIHGFTPSAIIDRSFRSGDRWEGVPAFHPDDYRPSLLEREEGIAIISLGKREYYHEIFGYLARLGFKKIILLRDIYEIHNPFGEPPELSEKGFTYYLENRDAILAAYDLLADDLSREVYVRYLQTHIHRRPTLLPQTPRNEQYFPTDVPLTKGHQRYVCCGCYDGDTVRLLHSLHGKVERIACFEPEAHLYERLSTYLQENAPSLAETVLSWPCAVYSDNAQRRFQSGDGLGSRISGNGSSVVQCIKLDSALAAFEPTFISMDVEGSEPHILKGAERLLHSYRPDLGICIYHAPNHAWEIPIMLHHLNLGYRFFIRNHTGFTLETVLYATE